MKIMKRIKNYKLFLESFDEDENFKSKMDELKKHLFKVFENIFNMEKLIRSTGDMNKIMAALDQKFKGQALARLDTYASKMDLLRVNAANATEIISLS